MGQKLKQKFLHEFGLQLKHVVIKSAVGISMPVDFEKRRALGSRELALCIAQHLKENMRGSAEIFVGQYRVGDCCLAGGLGRGFSALAMRRDSSEGNSPILQGSQNEGAPH